jgi:hypothetical protein
MLSNLRFFLLPMLQLLLIAFTERVVFVVYYRDSHFEGISLGDITHALLWGIRFDLAIAATFTFFACLLAYVLHRLARIRFITGLRHSTLLFAVLLLLLHGADIMYFDEAGRHLGYEVKEGLGSAKELVVMAATVHPKMFWFQLFLLIPILLFNNFLFNRGNPLDDDAPYLQKKSHPLHTELALLILLPICVLLVRGGLDSVPMEPLHAQEIGDTRQASIALNGPYNAVFSVVTPYSITPVLASKPDEAEKKRVRNLYKGYPTEAIWGQEFHYNVVMILLESWSGSYMQSYGYDKPTTPFFDDLRQKSLTTLATMAGGHRTTEGMFSTMCSWQNPLGQTVAQSQLQNYAYRCLPQILDERGYYTAFFQGTLKNTSGTGAFAQLLGFRHSYGREDVDDTQYPYNTWGLQDPDLYRYVLKQIKQMPQPFFVGINTNSTHSRELPPGVEPQFKGNDSETTYLNVLRFSDEALKSFMLSFANYPELSNTVFVLVADHASRTRDTTKPFEDTFNKYLLPFLIYAPGIVKPQQLDMVSSQRDIAPTLLYTMNIDGEAPFTGMALQDGGGTHAADYYHNGHLGWIEGNMGIEFNINDASQIHCFSMDKAPLKLQASDCGRKQEQQRQQARAFTHISQSLLFDGKTKEFVKFSTRAKR